MQPEQQAWNKKKIILTAAALAAVIILSLIAFNRCSSSGGSAAITALRCTSIQDVTPFGDSVLYYDGVDLFCLNSRGTEKWHYTLGSGARFNAGNRYVTAWTGSKLVIIDQNGISTYDNQLSDPIQFARTGDRYVAVVLGQDVSPTMIVKDLQGVTVDSETTAFEDTLMLDMGFFADGEYLWTTSLDIYGAKPDITLMTFRVNQTNSFPASLGDAMVYKIIYAGTRLNVISTRQLRRYDYRGVQDNEETRLVYGWQLIDSRVNGNNLQMLYARSKQTTSMELTDLRYLSGSTDKRFTLPNVCSGACIWNNRIYAFSAGTLYRAELNAQRFSAINITLPDKGSVTGFLGMLSDGTALLSGTGSRVYAVKLP